MTRLLCAVGIHRWRPLACPEFVPGCEHRECVRCGRTTWLMPRT